MAGPGTALLLIDLQRDVVRGLGGAPVAEAFERVVERASGLLERARKRGFPVLHVQHDGELGHRLERGTPGWELRPEVAPRGNEPVVHKRSPDAFFETKLIELLGSQNIHRLVVAGCMTEYCIDTTCRRAVSAFRNVVLVSDGAMNGGTQSMCVHKTISGLPRRAKTFSRSPPPAGWHTTS